MSIKKFISLLLLVAFAITSVPAQAVVSFNSGVTLPTLAQDPGNASDGANRDVVPLELRISYGGGDLEFATDPTTQIANGDKLTIASNGAVSVAGSGTFDNPRVAIFTPPTGTKFVKLNSNSDTYTDATDLTLSGNGVSGSYQINVESISAGTLAGFPSDGANGIVAATIIGASGASPGQFGTGAASAIPEGSLVVYFLAAIGATSGTTDASGNIVIDDIGLAADPGTSLSGTLTATYKEPTNANGVGVDEALSATDGTTVNVATAGSNAGKVEFIVVGTKTGTSTTTTEEPDDEPNTIIANKVTGTTVKIGPGFTNQGGTTSYLDSDALILRASETPESTVGTPVYHETAFATSAFVPTGTLLDNGAGATELGGVDVTSSSTFPNTSNARMTVTFALETSDGSASTATLAVDAVNVTLHGARAFDGIRDAATGGESTAVHNTAALARAGFLGAAINPENGGTSASNLGVAVLYNGTAANTDYDVVDNISLDYSAITNVIGLTGASRTVTSTNSNAAASSNPITAGFFPGSLVERADASFQIASWDLITDANGVGTAFPVSGFSGVSNGEKLEAPGEITVRMLNGASGADTIDNPAYFILTGSDNGDDLSGDGSIQIGATNTSTNSYEVGFDSQNGGVANNVILVSDLAANVLSLVPVSSKFDGIRDALSIRPEVTITNVDAAAKAAGVRLVATATGGNIDGSIKVTLAEILAELDADVSLTASALPVHGDMSTLRLMRHKTDDPGTSRASFNLGSVSATSTASDTIAEAVGSANQLDTTTPPLFCGGSIGTSTRGPNGVVFQPKARAVLISENGTTAFEDIDDLGANTVVRVTLPDGVDLNTYSATSSTIVGIHSGVGFSANPSIARVQGITSTIANAFVDIDVGTSQDATAADFRRNIALVFKPNSLVVPASVSSFDATVTIVNTGGTTVTTDDTTDGSLGTVSLASGCSTFLSVSYCPDSLSAFEDTTITSPASAPVESTRITRGSRQTTFSAPTTAVRLVNSDSATTTITLPDLCVEEGVADSLPLGTANDGVPSAFGESSISSIGTGTLHIAASVAGNTTAGAVGISGTNVAAADVLTSDSSIRATGAAGGTTNEVTIPLAEGNVSGRDRPFEQKTRIRIADLSVVGAAANTIPPAQDLIVWFEAAASTRDYVVGNSFGIAQDNVNTTTNEHFLVGISNGSSANDESKNYRNYFNSRTQDSTTAGSLANADFSDQETSAALNDITVSVAGGNAPVLSSAVGSIVDDSDYDTLSNDVELSVQLNAIDGETDVEAEVSAPAGSLEPGTLVTVATSGSGVADSVEVPVSDSGSFVAKLRAASGQQLVLTHAPTTNQSTKPPQVVTVDVEELNVNPGISSATASDIGLGQITAKGTVPVVFTVDATGRVDGADFVPTADQITLGGAAVTAVSGTTDQFIGLVDFSKSTGQTVTVTVDGSSSSVQLSALNSANPTLTARPILRRVKENKKGLVVLRGRRLRNAGTFGFVLDDGTLSLVDLRSATRTDRSRGRRRSSSVTSIPTNATHAVFHVPGRGISTVAL